MDLGKLEVEKYYLMGFQTIKGEILLIMWDTSTIRSWQQKYLMY